MYGARIMGKLRLFAPMALRRDQKNFQEQKKFGRRCFRSYSAHYEGIAMGKIVDAVFGFIKDFLYLVTTDTYHHEEKPAEGDNQTKFFIAVKAPFIGELYTASGPYDSFEAAEADFDIIKLAWADALSGDEYLGIVSHKE